MILEMGSSELKLISMTSTCHNYKLKAYTWIFNSDTIQIQLRYIQIHKYLHA